MLQTSVEVLCLCHITTIGSREATVDMDMALDNIVPESLNWRHTDEGPE